MPQIAHGNIPYRATIHSSLADAPDSSREHPLQSHNPFFLKLLMPQIAHGNILYTTTIHSSSNVGQNCWQQLRPHWWNTTLSTVPSQYQLHYLSFDARTAGLWCLQVAPGSVDLIACPFWLEMHDHRSGFGVRRLRLPPRRRRRIMSFSDNDGCMSMELFIASSTLVQGSSPVPVSAIPRIRIFAMLEMYLKSF